MRITTHLLICLLWASTLHYLLETAESGSFTAIHVVFLVFVIGLISTQVKLLSIETSNLIKG